VGFGGDGAQRHGAGGETLDDVLGRLDFVQRHRGDAVGAEREQAAQRQVALGLVVDDPRVLLEGGELVGTGRVLQLGDGVRRPQVVFATDTEGVFTARVEGVGQHRVGAEGGLVHADGFFGHVEHADAFNLEGVPVKYFSTKALCRPMASKICAPV
jgi:hypothetical protein